MNIKNVIKITGLSRKQIYFYIDSNLISVEHNQNNNYLDFSDQNVKDLQLIRKLRSLGLSIQNIKELFNNPFMINFILHKQYHDTLNDIFRKTYELNMISSIIDNALPKLNFNELDQFKIDALKQEQIESSLNLLFPNKDIRPLMIIFWSSFLNVDDTEYRLFLWQKLLKEASNLNTPYLENLINHLYSLDYKIIIEDASKRFKHTERIINNVDDLSTEKIVKDNLCNLLNNPMRYYKQFKEYIIPLYNIISRVSSIMINYHSENKIYNDYNNKLTNLLNNDHEFNKSLRQLNEQIKLPISTELLIFYSFECDLYKDIY